MASTPITEDQLTKENAQHIYLIKVLHDGEGFRNKDTEIQENCLFLCVGSVKMGSHAEMNLDHRSCLNGNK